MRLEKLLFAGLACWLVGAWAFCSSAEGKPVASAEAAKVCGAQCFNRTAQNQRGCNGNHDPDNPGWGYVNFADTWTYISQCHSSTNYLCPCCGAAYKVINIEESCFVPL